MLRSSGLKFGYSSEDSSIVKDFYIPALKSANHYCRAVGFFSSASLSIAARGLAPLLQSKGSMHLIIGYPVNAEDFQAIQKGVNIELQFQHINKQVIEFFSNLEDNLECRRFDALSYLVASGRLKIRFAFRPRGMYHEKIGVIRDGEGDRVAFIGSANETERALCDDLNSESISAYYSWHSEIYECYGIDIEDRFEKLWLDKQPITKTVEASAKFIEQLAAYHSGKTPDQIIRALNHAELFSSDSNTIEYNELPQLPNFLGRNKYELREHQKLALKCWQDNKFNGIMKLATGAGKTITALHASTVLSRHTNFPRGICLIVAVPYQGLAEQWHDEMTMFNINALLCYKSQRIWLQELRNRISEFNLTNQQSFMAIVVVNDTLKKEVFLNEINKVNPKRMLFVGDECHNHANKKLLSQLPNASLRLGLSATPWNDNEVDKQKMLEDYYGHIVARYGLKEAIEDNVLCPYDYFPIPCAMNDEEADLYEDMTLSIAKLEATRESGYPINEDALMHLYLKRTRLLGNLESKLEELEVLVSTQGIQTHTLFYCGEGGVENDLGEDESTIDEVTKILDRHGWRTSKFTSEQSLSVRKQIMTSFKNAAIDALVSKRVLDEGIDVPACSQAIIMASTRNERQYVQRRGRVLRRAAGKEKAIIYDFVAIPPEDRCRVNCFISMLNQEMNRVNEFSSLSINKLHMDIDYGL